MFNFVCLIAGNESETNEEDFTGVLSRQLFWAVLIESKRYGKHPMSLSQIQQGAPFPTVALDGYAMMIRNRNNLILPQFPETWKKEAPPQPQPILPTVPQQQLPPFPPGFSNAPPQGFSPFSPLQGQFGSWQQNPNIGHMPQRIVQALETAHKVDPSVKLRHFFAAAKQKSMDMPLVQGQRVCINYLMGKCATRGCMFQHLPLSMVPKQFVDTWSNVMEEGAKKIKQDGKLPSLRFDKNGKRKRDE